MSWIPTTDSEFEDLLSWATAARAAMRKGPLARLAKTSRSSADSGLYRGTLGTSGLAIAILHRFPHGPGHLPAVLWESRESQRLLES